MKKVIYCFSGTGNSLNAAKIIAAQIDGASIVSVKKGTVSELAADADVVGFICPVYENHFASSSNTRSTSQGCLDS